MRKAFFTLLLLFVTFTLYARPISSIGEGKTIKEAESEAFSSLARSIYSSVSSTAYSSDYEVNNDYNSVFQNEVVIQTDVSLVGVTYIYKPKNGDNYVVEAQILEDVAPSYERDYQSAIAFIERNKNKVVSDDLKEQFEYYNTLYKTYRKAKSYAVVYNILTDNKHPLSRDVEDLINSTELEYKYQKSLNEYNDFLSRRIKGAEYEKDSEKQLEELRKELQRIDAINESEEKKVVRNDTINSQKERREIEEKINKHNINDIQSNIIKTLSDIDAIKRISEGKKSFVRAINGQISYIENDIARIDKQRDKDILEMRQRPYAIADMANGKVIEAAEKERDEEIAERRKYYEDKKNTAIQAYLRNTSNISILLDESVLKPLNEFENTTYNARAYTKENKKEADSVIYVYAYNGEKTEWPISISVGVLGGQDSFWFDSHVSYEELSGKVIPKRSDKVEFNKYRKEVAVYQDLMMDKEKRSSLVYADISIKYKEFFVSTFEVEATVRLMAYNSKEETYKEVFNETKTKRVTLPKDLYYEFDIYNVKDEKSGEYKKLVFNEVLGKSKLAKSRIDRYNKNQEILSHPSNAASSISTMNTSNTNTNKTVSRNSNGDTSKRGSVSTPRKVNVSFFYSIGYDFSVDLKNTSGTNVSLHMGLSLSIGMKFNRSISIFLEATPTILYSKVQEDLATRKFLHYDYTMIGLGVGWIIKEYVELDFSFGTNEHWRGAYLMPKVTFRIPIKPKEVYFEIFVAYRYQTSYLYTSEFVLGVNINGT